MPHDFGRFRTARGLVPVGFIKAVVVGGKALGDRAFGPGLA